MHSKVQCDTYLCLSLVMFDLLCGSCLVCYYSVSCYLIYFAIRCLEFSAAAGARGWGDQVYTVT